MRRAAPLIALLAALLAHPASGLAKPKTDFGGHSPPTKKLEAAFSTALSERVGSKKGCYPAARRLAKVIRKDRGFRTGVARGAGSARVPGTVYVLRGTSCGRVRMALRDKRRVFVLDSFKGEIAVRGRKRRPEWVKGNRGPLRALSVSSRTFRLARANFDRVRFEARCRGRTLPLGGSMTSAPGLGADGEGVYPHSFERLGAQRGWHVTAWLRDPSGGHVTPRAVTVQVVCGLGLAPRSAPRKTKFVKPGQTKQVVARCPRGQYLMSGGFQRTDFLIDGGNYVTESRAAGPTAWRVTGHAYGRYGGELTAIAYCVKARGPLLEEVSASTPLPFGTAATATTPPCPPGRRLTLGGFSANGSQLTFFAGGTINPDNTWSATSYGAMGSAPALTAYGYCLQPGV